MPLLLMKRMSGIAKVNTVVIILTLVSIGIVIYYSSAIINNSEKENLEQFNLVVTDKDESYKYWDSSMLPLFMAGVMNVYEGNMVILNIYAEHSNPKNFFCVLATSQVVITVLIGSMATLGYLAFGTAV